MEQLQMNPEIARRWVDALRSGKYKQGEGRLGRIEKDGPSFCCLGVLCEMAVGDGVIESEIRHHPYSDDAEIVYKCGDDMNVAVPPVAVRKWAFPDYDDSDPENTTQACWSAKDVDGKFPHAVDDRLLSVADSVHLPDVNDNWAASFDEIADMIEATHL